MGIISRHAGAPFADGETLAGADLEGDFATIYAEFNGNIEAANLKDGAVTNSKLAATAVTQAKMTSGAASASEAQVEVGATGYPVSTSYTNVGTAISHVVGNPARHVIIIASWLVVFQATTTGINIKMLKDAGQLNTPTFADLVENHEGVQVFAIVTRMFIDTAPTPGATHTYQLQVKGNGAAAGCYNLNLVAFEPRS